MESVQSSTDMSNVQVISHHSTSRQQDLTQAAACTFLCQEQRREKYGPDARSLRRMHICALREYFSAVGKDGKVGWEIVVE